MTNENFSQAKHPEMTERDLYEEWRDKELLKEHAAHPERFADHTGPDHIREVMDEVVRSPEWEAEDVKPDIEP